jgi:hypothetical protein
VIIEARDLDADSLKTVASICMSSGSRSDEEQKTGPNNTIDAICPRMFAKDVLRQQRNSDGERNF